MLNFLFKFVVYIKIFMIIERTKSEVIFRVPNNLDVALLQDLADLFEFKEVARKSKATQSQVDLLVKSIKKGRWKKTKEIVGL